MNLQERLQSELIGENDIVEFGDPLKHPSTASQQAFGRDKLRESQRKAFPELATTIATDLKGMLPEKDGHRHMTRNYCENCMQRDAYNQAIEQCVAVIDSYCGVNESREAK